MRIKKIRIQGFKSYKEADIEEFDPGVNVIVGHNGSGKSNFFFAIRFLLSDECSNMSSEERQSLLHEGQGLAVLSGYVEIVFDNTDERFPMEETEVVIRRSFGGKKDEYFLNGKHTTKTDMSNLLETAGFSRSNPYYMVQQGKIAALTTMKNEQRLELLKEVAGTKVYEDRRVSSVKLLEETDNKRQKIDEILGYIDDRLKELEEEEQELRQFMVLDRKRRAIEYAINDKELQDTRAKLDQYESQRQSLLSRFEDLHVLQTKAQDKLKELENDITTKESELQGLVRDRKFNEEERQDALRRRAEFELDVRDLNEKFSRTKSRDAELKKELEDITNEISEINKKLETITGEYATAASNEISVRERMGHADVRLKALNAKQGRQKMFTSQAERDKFLSNELASANEELETKVSKRTNLQEQITTIGQDMKRADDIVADIRKQIDGKRTESDEACKKLTNAKKDREVFLNNRRELWHREQELEQQRTVYNEKLAAAVRALHGKMPRNINAGLNSIKTWSDKGLIKGRVYGPVLELFQSDPRFYSAIEVTAGNSLFHVVVDTDETASEILKLMQQDNRYGGRITFMPLNRLEPKPVKYPESHDAVPLLSKLEFSQEFSKAFTQIFGKTLVCRNLDVAAQMSRQYELDCVTLDGDQVSRKGAMTGGYHDSRVNRLNLMQALRETAAKLRSVANDLTGIKAQIAELDQKISVASGEQQKLDNVHMKARDSQEQLRIDLDSFDKERITLKTLYDNRTIDLKELNVSISETEQQIQSLTDEMAGPMRSTLSAAEMNTLHKLTAEITSIREELMVATEKRASIESQKSSLEARLSGHLEKRRQEILQELSVSEVGELGETTRQNSHAFDAVSKEVEDTSKRAKDISAKMDALENEVKNMRAEQEKTKNDENEAIKQLQDAQTDVSKLQVDRALGLQKCEEHSKAIRELGSIPQEEYDKIKNLNMDKLHVELRKSNEALEKYSHVNKKAAIQYETFKDRRVALEKDRKKCSESAASIREMIVTLDRKKDEAIHRSFQHVSGRFSEVWKELCPNGEGHLLMLTNEDQSQNRQFSGVSMQVKFGPGSQMQPLQLLSGGQKTLAALALIFAIQRSDPAPFYLFDEIDAALDDEHRVAVASLVAKQAHPVDKAPPVQFIISTFHPQLVNVCDKSYRVTFTQPVSNITAVSQNAALAIANETGRRPKRDDAARDIED